MADKFDKDALRSAIDLTHYLDYTYDYVSPQDSHTLLEVLHKILEIKNLEEIFDEMSYILMELITNANKAGVKQIFFHLKEIEIHDSIQYQEILPEFTRVIQSGFEPYIPYFSRLGLKTTVRFEFMDNVFWIKVSNNRSATAQEEERIHAVIKAVGQIKNTLEAFDKFADQTEGANLGTLTTLLLLRRIGLTEQDYLFENVNNQTKVSLRIRMDIVTNQQADRIADEVATAIENLPAFPDNIIRIQQLILDRGVQFTQIARIIQSDPALTAELLREVNSAQYMLPQKVSNILNAITLIGLQGLNNLLYSIGAQYLFYENFGRFSQLWEHSRKTAFYASYLAQELALPHIREDVYVGGILHDMGKILLYQLNYKLLSTIKDHCQGRIAGEILLERLAIGAPHARIGSGIAQKWNFPPFLVDIIRYHHTPLLAPDHSKEMTAIVYLANILSNVTSKNDKLDSVKEEILEFLHIERDKLLSIENKLRQLYLNQDRK